MLFKWLKRLKQEKHQKILDKRAVFGKSFCERPSNGDKMAYIYHNIKIKNAFGRDKVVFGDYNNVSVSVYLTENGSMYTGDYVYANSNCKFHISNRLSIGNYCMFGPNVTIWDSGNHALDPKLRMQDALAMPKGSLNAFDVGGGDIVIEDNVWIGMESLILGGVTIGTNSVVAARSVVTKDVPENCMVAGNPAKVIKKIGNE